ncbi:uncharacterized protein UV8b_03596 [Ustilaginoidea virens]|uniref:Uncharacterized protein n=1 Tax=Ustilaginoidea virens TaxID=1159556 RepID=A0A8E5HPM6_USTVR|nr:uncharacterized protein UV8b_03596 [Ustilaginoidea virens]QUC19355.1 hypothetical protein UV8b_03596 [Ustilaginoidea virens]
MAGERTEASPPDLEGAFAKQQETLRSHSFQLVRLQNQIQQLQNKHLQDVEEKADMMAEIHRSRSEIAYLKGRLACLAVEFYSTSTCAATNHHAPSRSFNGSATDYAQKEPTEEKTDRPCMATVEALRAAVEQMADRLLSEQRPFLMRVLQDFASELDPLLLQLGNGENKAG